MGSRKRMDEDSRRRPQPNGSNSAQEKRNRGSVPPPATQGVTLPSFNAGESEATISSLFLAI